MASASPLGDGAQNRAGRAKANSSSTSSRSPDLGGAASPSLLAVSEACATSTGPVVNAPSAAPRPILRAPSSSQIAPAPGGTASAGGSASHGSAPVRPMEEGRVEMDTARR
jgi:hypothetical protein